jgi:hypothetical protein
MECLTYRELAAGASTLIAREKFFTKQFHHAGQ